MRNRDILVAIACSSIAVNSWAADTKPRIDTSGVNAQPPYPASALPDRESGAVILVVAVNAGGTVDKVGPIKTSGFPDLDAAAISGVMNWRFVPATSDGKSVAGSALVQIVFDPPDDKSGQPSKAGVQTDYLSSEITLDAPLGKESDDEHAIPCVTGSVSVSMQFYSVKTEPNSVNGDAYLAVTVGSKTGSAWVSTFPAYYPPVYQFVNLGMTDATGKGQGVDTFQFKPNYRKPTVLELSWTQDGQITATVGSQDLRITQISGQPTSLTFSAASAVGKFTDARLFCTPK